MIFGSNSNILVFFAVRPYVSLFSNHRAIDLFKPRLGVVAINDEPKFSLLRS
jgi:hypothetical protein